MSKRKPKAPKLPAAPINRFPFMIPSQSPVQPEFVNIDLNKLVKNKLARQVVIRLEYQGSMHQVTLTRNG